MTKEYKDLKKNINYVLVFIASFIIVFLGLTLIIKPLMKSDKERMQEHFSEDVVKGMVQDAFSKYIDLNIKNISIDYNATEDAKSISTNGDAISNQYGEKTFSFIVTFAVGGDGTINDGVEFGSVVHKGVGTIVDLNGEICNDMTYVDSDTFKKKLSAYNSEQREINEEYKNAVKLAYQNKTKVHFGITETEYKKTANGFKRNFIDGLIGKGTFDQEVELDFAKGKFVGFKVHSRKYQHLNYSHVDKVAKCTKNEAETVGRFDVYKYNYVCNLYNLQIYKRSTNYGTHEDDGEEIDILWNSYLKLYE